MPEIICENIPRYGVVVVVVVIIMETNDISEIENFGVEISDMFLRKFIVTYSNVQNNFLILHSSEQIFLSVYMTYEK